MDDAVLQSESAPANPRGGLEASDLFSLVYDELKSMEQELIPAAALFHHEPSKP